MKLRPLPEPVWRQHSAARLVFWKAVREGHVLGRPFRCDRCKWRPRKRVGGRDGLDAHHPDYSKPLEVEWLCHSCHQRADIEQRAIDRATPAPVVAPSCCPCGFPKADHIRSQWARWHCSELWYRHLLALVNLAVAS